MRIVRPNRTKVPEVVPVWLDDARKMVVRYSELNCGCIVERLPKCIVRIAGKHPEIECSEHGFQRIKRDIPIREIIARQTNLAIDDKLIPPF